MNRIFLAFKNAALTMMPVWIFFLFTFELLRITQLAVLGEYGLKSENPSMVIIGSFIVANVFRLIDKTRLVTLFDDKPLAYTISWKTLIYTIGTFVLYYINRLVSLLLAHDTPAHANSTLVTEMTTPRFWMLRVWLVFLLLIYCSVREIKRTIGRERFMNLFFGRNIGSHD